MFKKIFIGEYDKSVAVSYLGVAFAIIGMYYLFSQKFKFAMICLVGSGICDLFDGLVARRIKNRTADGRLFGIQLDSLADVVGFLAFPIVFGYNLGLNEWYHVLGYSLLVIAGIQRLCYFNVVVINKTDSSPVKHYTGLPVTSTSITFPLLWLLSHHISVSLYHTLFIVLIYATAFLFVLRIKIPKFKGMAYPLLALTATIFTIIAVFFR